MADLTSAPHFDRVAGIYRAMEYLSFGPILERCRFAHISALAGARRALVLGDGDGRFLARLLAANRHLHADAVDASPAMLALLRARVRNAGAEERLRTSLADIRHFEPGRDHYDAVVTHFFLDCLSAAESEALIARTRPLLAPDAVWLVSEFQVSTGSPIAAAVSSTIIASLYAAFGLLTGLAVREIPPWRDQLSKAGLHPIAARAWLGGLLVSELWQLPQTTAFPFMPSHQKMQPPNQFDLQPMPATDPGPVPMPEPPAVPEPTPAPGPAPEPDPMPYPGPLPTPQPVTRA